MSKLHAIYLVLVALTFAWPSEGRQADAESQPCTVTTRSGSRACTAQEETELIMKQRRTLDHYQPRTSDGPFSVEEAGHALRRLLLNSPPEGAAAPAAEKLKRILSNAAERLAAADKPKPPRQ